MIKKFRLNKKLEQKEIEDAQQINFAKQYDKKFQYEAKEDFLERERLFVENKQKKIQKQALQQKEKEQQDQQHPFQPKINASNIKRTLDDLYVQDTKNKKIKSKKNQKDIQKSRSKSPMLTSQLSQRFYDAKNKSLEKIDSEGVINRLQDYGLKTQKNKKDKLKQQTKDLFKPQIYSKQMKVNKKIDNSLEIREKSKQKQDFVKKNKSKTKDIKKKFIVYKEAKNISKKMEAPYLMQDCWHQNSYMNVNEKNLVEMKSKEICSNIQFDGKHKNHPIQIQQKHQNDKNQRDRKITEGLPNVFRATKNTIPFGNTHNYESLDSFGDSDVFKEDRKRNTMELNSYFQKTHQININNDIKIKKNIFFNNI